MLQLNLLPEEFFERKKQRARRRLVSGICVLAVVIVSAFSFAVFSYQRKLDNEIAVIDRRLAELRPVVENLKAVEKERENLRKKLGLIEELLKDQALWVKLMDELNRTLLEGVYFESLNAGGGVFTIDGRVVATSQRGAEENLTQYLSKMKESPMFADIDFSFTKQREDNSSVQLAFVLRFRIKS